MTKTEIVDAALKVWGRGFYKKTSLSQLAKELGVSKPALYRHFENKQALISAMIERFFDDFAGSIRADYELALKTGEPGEQIFGIIKAIAGFYARNIYAFIFSLINVYDRKSAGRIAAAELKSRGVDMEKLYTIMKKKYRAEPVMLRLIFPSLVFFMGYFHKTKDSIKNPPPEKEIEKIISFISQSLERGLAYSTNAIDALNFDELEMLVKKTMPHIETEPLFRAIAEAVGEAGPWDVSMDMVAQRLGISKSSLYGHFKNKKDMLRRLFTGEFKRILAFAKQSISLSSLPSQQLYLGIFSIAVYLRSHSDLLAALDWIRTRKLDLDKPEKNVDIFRLFEEVDIEPIKKAGEDEKQRVSHWILFLIVNILMHHADNAWPDESSNGNAENNDIRVLYRFVTLGLEGFIK